MKDIVIFLILSVVPNVYGVQQRVDPLVLIGQGLVRGQKSTDGDYSAFLGIPYAKVDLDDPFGVSKLRSITLLFQCTIMLFIKQGKASR